MRSKDELEREFEKLIEFCRNYQLTDYARKLENKLNDLRSPLKVMIVGEGKSGKSTLLNALVGADVADVDDEPKTWCINLYTKTERKEEYAELVYTDGIEETSTERAREISERISSSEIRKLGKRDTELMEIRWYLNLPWPEQNIFIVDTPGFNQDRNNTSVEEFSMNLGEGVKFISNDGFDKYYYKADLVLWCFNADSVNDSQVEQHLNSVKAQKKKTYGIITKLDRVEDEKDRERLFQQNENRYMRYNLTACLRSALPQIYDDDDEDEIEEKRRFRANTISGVRTCIEYLLMDNKADDLKIEASKNYITSLKKDISSVMEQLMECYRQNYELCRKEKGRYHEHINPYEESAVQRIRQAYQSDIAKFSSPFPYQEAWEFTGQDVDLYAQRMAELTGQADVFVKGDLIWNDLHEEITQSLMHLMEKIEWKTVSIKLYDRDDGDEGVKIELELPRIEVPKHTAQIAIRQEQLGAIYGITRLFGKGSFMSQVLTAVAGERMRRRAVEAGMEAVTNEIDNQLKDYEVMIHDFAVAMGTEYEKTLEEMLLRITGHSFTDLPQTIFDIEQGMYTAGVLEENSVYYYPVCENGSLSFLVSKYRKLLEMEPEIDSKVVGVVFWKMCKSLFTRREEVVTKTVQTALLQYNGTKGVDAPRIEFNFKDPWEDSEICANLPESDRIVWKDSKKEVEKAYRNVRQDYYTNSKRIWTRLSKDAQKKVLNSRMKQMEESMREDFVRFRTMWEAQVQSDVNYYLTNRVYTLPQNLDYFNYYYSIYLMTFGNTTPIGLVVNFVKKGVVPEDFVRNWALKAVDGEPMLNETRTVVESVFMKQDEELRSFGSSIGKKYWDSFFESTISGGKKICDRYMYMLYNFLCESVSLEWEKYKAAPKEGKPISNMLEYAIKTGTLPANLKSFLIGNIPEIIQFQNMVLSDKVTVSDKLKDYIKQELKDYSRNWK